jgi:hypothetical protein
MKNLSKMLSFTTFLMFRKSLTRKLSLILVFGTILSCIVWTTTAIAATEAEKQTAIENGLAYLASIQQPGGYWNYGGYEQAATGAAAFTFLSQKNKWGANAAQYQTAVDNAISYLLNNASTNTVSTRNDGVNICPGGSGSCTGIYWYGAGESTYTTGLVAPAIAAYGSSLGANVVATSSGPLAGMTWGQIAQGITNEFAASQSTSINGNRDGGWRYYIPGNGDSDMSTTQWAVISMIYDQTLGAITPQSVKDELKIWLAAVQVNGQGGAACYQPDYLLCDHADTGGLLLSLILVGDTLSDPAVQAALGFLNTNWTQTANSTWYGNFGHPYAMWSVYKGLETTIGLKDNTYITNLLTTCGAPGNLPGNPPGSVPCNWWEDYNEWLVRNQNLDGSWTGYDYWTDPLSTAFDINILGATLIPLITCGDGTCNGTETCSTCPQDCGVCPNIFKAAVFDDSDFPMFYISQKLHQFTYTNTNYYSGCEDVLFPPDPRITSDCTDFGYAFLCPSACSEHFKPVKVSAIEQPEVCCATPQAMPDAVAEIPVIECPAEGTAMISSGNSGEYEWVIGLPKKPMDEINIEIECGVLKPNSWSLFGYDAINKCAAETGEPIGPNCTRIPGQYLYNSALPKLEVIAHPGCNNDFKPFHLTALRNPSTYNIVRKASGALANAQALQVLDGKAGTRIALKACMEKTILVKWPVDGEVNALGEKETALEAGDLIKVRMIVPNANTVDLYCGKYSVTIGGIGELNSLLNDEECDCISDAECQF